MKRVSNPWGIQGRTGIFLTFCSFLHISGIINVYPQLGNNLTPRGYPGCGPREWHPSDIKVVKCAQRTACTPRLEGRQADLLVVSGPPGEGHSEVPVDLRV